MNEAFKELVELFDNHQIGSILKGFSRQLDSEPSFSTEFKAYEGTVDSSGESNGSSEIQDYDAAVYEFATGNFDNPIQFLGHCSTDSSKLNITLPLSRTDTHYAIYFYKDGYITWESTCSANSRHKNGLGEYYTEDILFAKRTEAEADIKLVQCDQSASGSPMNIEATIKSSLEHTDYTGYIPDGSMGGPDLTSFYQTDVRYSLDALTLSNNKRYLKSRKTLSDTATIEFQSITSKADKPFQ
jgi:hypothetical protein